MGEGGEDIRRRLTEALAMRGRVEVLRPLAGGGHRTAAMPPALARACRAALAPVAGRGQAAIHGGLNPGNVLIPAEGPPALLDWDECRLDKPLLDRAALAGGPVPPALERARIAWEVAVSRRIEPDHARRMAAALSGAAAAG